MFSQRQWHLAILLFLAMTPFSWGLEIGVLAPEFVVTRAGDGEEVKLSDFHGKSNVILNTLLPTDASIDTAFMAQLQSKTDAFQTKYDAVLITVIPESLEAIASFKKRENLDLDLYSDPEWSVGKTYGASKLSDNGETVHQPMTFIIDKSRHIRWKSYIDAEAARPTMEQLESELAKLKRNMPLPVGSPAPDFSLTEADGKTTFTLSDYRGKKNVLATLLLQTY